MYKLLAIDLDGTLLNSYGTISNKNKQAIKKAKEKGIEVVIASGRHINLLLIIYTYIFSPMFAFLLLFYNSNILYNSFQQNLSKISSLKKLYLSNIYNVKRQYVFHKIN